MKKLIYIFQKHLYTEVNKAKFDLNETILDFIVKQSINKIIKERCKDMGYIESQRENEIKLFGNNNLFIDNSIWVNINDETSVADLYFTKAEIYFVLKEILRITDMEGDYVKIYELSQNEKINNILDIKHIIKNNFNKI